MALIFINEHNTKKKVYDGLCKIIKKTLDLKNKSKTKMLVKYTIF